MLQRYALPIFLLIIVVWAVVLFNKLIRNRNRLREAWSGIEVQLKRRHDLVPSLVECVKAYQKHESATLESVINKRNAAQHAQTIEAQEKHENELSHDLIKVIALAEDYPNLTAGEHFKALAKDLVDIENHLQYARRYYNGSARDLNNLIQGFPSLIIARLCKFKEAPFFEVENVTERLSPKVNQHFNS